MAAKKAPRLTQAGTPFQAQCLALTADGAQCRNSSRINSKYCASHKGYQPPTTKGLAKRIEGESWSPKDKLTDRQSAGNADTRPAVRGAKDTSLATRRGSKKAAAPAPKATARKRTKAPQTTRTTPPSDPGFMATLLSPERDYLVVYEEPDPDGMPTDDGLLLDIDAGEPVSLGEVDLEQKLDLELSNNTNWVGRLGFILAIVGAVLGLALTVYYGMTYPEDWYDERGNAADTSILPGTALVAVIVVLMMLAGVVLTHYGRRIQAKGNLSRMRIVEKAFQPRVALGEE